MSAITIKVNGTEMSLEDARKLYDELAMIFGKRPEPYIPMPPRDSDWKIPWPYEITCRADRGFK